MAVLRSVLKVKTQPCSRWELTSGSSISFHLILASNTEVRAPEWHNCWVAVRFCWWVWARWNCNEVSQFYFIFSLFVCDFNWFAADFFLKATIVASSSEPVNQYDTYLSFLTSHNSLKIQWWGVCQTGLFRIQVVWPTTKKMADETRKKLRKIFFVKRQR